METCTRTLLVYLQMYKASEMEWSVPVEKVLRKTFNRMLTEFGQLSGTLGRDLNGNLTSLITGKKVFNDVVNESLVSRTMFLLL